MVHHESPKDRKHENKTDIRGPEIRIRGMDERSTSKKDKKIFFGNFLLCKNVTNLCFNCAWKVLRFVTLLSWLKLAALLKLSNDNALEKFQSRYKFYRSQHSRSIVAILDLIKIAWQRLIATIRNLRYTIYSIYAFAISIYE